MQGMRKFFKRNLEPIIVIFLAGFFAFLSVFHVWYQALRTPVGKVSMWMGHYWEDYYTYLHQVDQGLRGKWLLGNMMTGEDVPKNLICWVNLLVGQVGRLFGLSAPLAYWLGVLCLNFLTVILIYFVMVVIFEKRKELRLPAFLVALFSSSFYWWVWKYGEKGLVLLEHWYSTGPALSRLAAVPHHGAENVLLLVSILLFYKCLRMIEKKKLGLRLWGLMVLNGIVLGFDALMQPAVILVFFLAFGLVLLFKTGKEYLKRKKINFYYLAIVLVATPFLVAAGGYLVALFGKSYFVQIKGYEVAVAKYYLLERYVGWGELFLSLGPVVFLAILGGRSFLRGQNPVRLVGFLTILVFFIIFWHPVGAEQGQHPFRFTSPVMHVFLASMAVLGMEVFAELAVRVLKRGSKESKKRLFLVFLTAFLFYSLPALWLDVKKRARDPNFRILINFMPKEVYEGLMFLRGIGEEREVVLAAGGLGIPTTIPALAAKRVYLGRTVLTLDYAKKYENLNKFFELKIRKEEVEEFFKEGKIKYVLVTVYDGDRREFEEKYGLEGKIFENNLVTIYEVN